MPGKFQTGNEEVDRQFGGSLPFPSLMLLEGDLSVHVEKSSNNDEIGNLTNSLEKMQLKSCR